MRRMTYFVMALVLVLGLAQCKKEQPTPQSEGNVVMITLNVDGGASTGSATNGSRAEVDPPHVTFVEGDTILVASDGKYVGYLVHNGSTFNGNITNPTVDQPFYFYFLGNKIKVSTLTAGTTNECTVNISDQSNYPHLPVISMGVSHETYPSEGNSYTSRLYNKASLMKFNVTTPSTAPICITGMNNKVTVDFTAPSDTDYGFTYGMDGNGVIKMHGVTSSNTETWAIVLPQEALGAGSFGSAYTEDLNTQSNCYLGSRPSIPVIGSNEYIVSGVETMTMADQKYVDLSEQNSDVTAKNGQVLTGTLPSGKYISIASDATVTLNNVTINNGGGTGLYYGINCVGNATLILAGTNSITVNQRAAILAPPSGYTLVIESDPDSPGTLTASSDYYRAIGGTTSPVGNITINGGNITANGGIGSSSSSCGDITINGGTVNVPLTARTCAAIGSGSSASCGNITITGGTVTATNQTTNNIQAGAGIGSGVGGSCGTITINGGTVSAKGGGRNSSSVGGAAAIGCGYEGSCSGVVIGNGITQIVATVIPQRGKRFGASTSLNAGTFGGLTIGSNYFGNKEPTKTGDIDNSNLKVSVHSYYSMTIVPQ